MPAETEVRGLKPQARPAAHTQNTAKKHGQNTQYKNTRLGFAMLSVPRSQKKKPRLRQPDTLAKSLSKSTMGRPQDDELDDLRSELEGDPQLADTFARLEPGPNSLPENTGDGFSDPLAGLVPLDQPEPSTQLRPPSRGSGLPKLHDDEEEGDREPTQRYVKTMHDLPGAELGGIASDPYPPANGAKPLRTPSSYIGRIPRAPISSPGNAPTVPAGVPMRRPPGQNPMLSYSGSGRSLPQSAPLHPMSPANKLDASTDSQAARTIPMPQPTPSYSNSVQDTSSSNVLPAAPLAPAVPDSQAVPSTAATPYAPAPVSAPARISAPPPVRAPLRPPDLVSTPVPPFSPEPAAVESQENTDAGVSAPAESAALAAEEREPAPSKNPTRTAILLAVAVLSAAATLAVLLFVVKPMRSGAQAGSGASSAVPAAPPVTAAPAETPSALAAPPVTAAPEPSAEASAAPAASESAAGADSAAPSSSASAPVAVAPSAPVPVGTVVRAPPVTSASLSPPPPSTARPPATATNTAPKPTGTKISPIFDF